MSILISYSIFLSIFLVLAIALFWSLKITNLM